jgi:hypothetical protein
MVHIMIKHKQTDALAFSADMRVCIIENDHVPCLCCSSDAVGT